MTDITETIRRVRELDAESDADTDFLLKAAPLLADEVERLMAENAARREELRLAQCPNPRDPEHGGHCETCSGLSVARTRRLSELESEVERLLAREAELEEALRPFAACSVGLDDPDAEGDIDWAEESLTLADVRTARAALAKGDR